MPIWTGLDGLWREVSEMTWITDVGRAVNTYDDRMARIRPESLAQDVIRNLEALGVGIPEGWDHHNQADSVPWTHEPARRLPASELHL